MYTKRKLLRGVGINDADYSITKWERKQGKAVSVWHCPFYRSWANLLGRCYSESALRRSPSYTECTVCDEWLTFSNFKAWMETQDWEGKQLDKDILFPGNKVYSPGTCVFVSKSLNIFLTLRNTCRGEYPLGVWLHKPSGRFGASCNEPFTKRCKTIGYFDTPEEAHEAWRKRKHELACQYADMQTDPRVAEALRTRFAPQE